MCNNKSNFRKINKSNTLYTTIDDELVVKKNKNLLYASEMIT